MKEKSFERLNKAVPKEQREIFRTLRVTRPYRITNMGGALWEYITRGEGSQAMLLLGKGLSVGEMSLQRGGHYLDLPMRKNLSGC